MGSSFAARTNQLLSDIEISESSNWRYGESDVHFLKQDANMFRLVIISKETT